MNWEKVKISDVAETGSGGTPARIKQNEYYNGDIPWVKSGELKSNLILKTEEYINEKAILESSSKLVPKNSILVALYGATVGNTAILGIDAATNQAVCFIIPKKDQIESKYIFYLLKSRINELLSMRVGGAQPNISQHVIKNLTFPLPPLSEQKKIVEILEQADELRKKKKEVIEKSEKIITSLFYKMFGDPVKNEMGWNENKLQNIVTLNYGDSLQRGNRKNGKYPVYGSNGIVGYHECYLIDYPTIIIGRKGSAGSVNLVKEPSYPIDTTFYTEIEKDLNIDFLFQFLKIFDLKKLAITTGVPGVNREDIYKQKIILPPIELQNKFSQLSISTREIIDGIQNTTKDVNELFENLLYRAFTSELTKTWREENKELLISEVEKRKLTYGF